MSDAGGGANTKEWAVVLDAGQHQTLLDLPWDKVVTLAKEQSTSWAAIVDSPLGGTGKLMLAVYRTTCIIAGVKPAKKLTAREIVAKFILVDGTTDAPDTRVGSLQWTLTLPDGEVVKLWDLEWRLLARIAEESLVPWEMLLDRPLGGTGEVASALYAAVCELFEQEPRTDMTVREMLDMWDVIPDDKPTVFDGGLPAPKVGDPTTD